MCDRLRNLLEQTLLSAVIVGEAEGPCDIEGEFAFAIGCADLRRETPQGEALFDVSASSPAELGALAASIAGRIGVDVARLELAAVHDRPFDVNAEVEKLRTLAQSPGFAVRCSASRLQNKLASPLSS